MRIWRSNPQYRRDAARTALLLGIPVSCTTSLAAYVCMETLAYHTWRNEPSYAMFSLFHVAEAIVLRFLFDDAESKRRVIFVGLIHFLAVLTARGWVIGLCGEEPSPTSLMCFLALVRSVVIGYGAGKGCLWHGITGGLCGLLALMVAGLLAWVATGGDGQAVARSVALLYGPVSGICIWTAISLGIRDHARRQRHAKRRT